MTQEPHREAWLPNEMLEGELEGVRVAPGPPAWKIWGDKPDSLFEGTEEEVKDEYAAEYVGREDTYIEDPHGNEYIWDVIAGEWRLLQ